MLTEKQTLLAAFDDAWSHKWESFEGVTKDLTEEEVQFQHPAYVDEKQEDGWPLPGTILWQLVHIEYWYTYYIECLERPTDTSSTLPQVNAKSTLAEAMQQLLATRKTLRDRIHDLPDEGLDFMLLGRIRTGEFIRMIIRHDAWHSSQIAVARRLYRSANK
jgi:hypothetical protein